MERTLKKAVVNISKEAAFILVTVIGAVVLPQILHGAGVLLGVGGRLGQIFLPMYLPVLILGFYRVPAAGAVAGLLAPMASFAVTEMPAEAVLPYITVELIALGALAGVFSKWRIHAALRVLAVQAGAKLVRLAAFAVASYSMSGGVSMQTMLAGIPESLPGILIQLALVTFLVMKREEKSDD